MRTLVASLIFAAALLGSATAGANLTPPQQLNAGSAVPTLDSSYRNEAWLVYTYDIDSSGQVVNVQIHSSNGVPEVEQVTFSGGRGRAQGQEVTVVTERCVLRQTDRGLCVTEIAPGVDLARDVLGQADFPLAVSPGLAEMDPRLFRPEPMSLALGPARRRWRTFRM